MSYLLDTNIISELRKPQRRANAGVRSWVSSRAAADLSLSAITILEIEVGIGRLSRRDPVQAKPARGSSRCPQVRPHARAEPAARTGRTHCRHSIRPWTDSCH